MAAADHVLSAEALAHLRFARMAPRKLRRVADAIRGLSVQEALTLLRFSDVFAAAPIEKLLRSAIANAENNHNMTSDDLFVTRITVDGGPGGGFTKRLDPRAQGRAAFKRKRMSHVTIALSSTPPKKRPRAPGASIVVGQSTVRQRPAAPPPTSSRRGRKKKEAAAAAASSGDQS
jgi:large subunit ribosomal protein L22